MAVNRLATPDRVVLLLSLVPYLIENGKTPLSTLAQAFGVDEHLMRELVEFLGTAGSPGETNTYQDEDLFDIDWVALEEEDVVRLVRAVVVEDAPRFSMLERAALIAGLHALTPMLPEAEIKHAQSAASKLGSAQVLSTSAEVENPLLAVVAHSIEKGENLSFVYEDLRGEVSSRTVEPRALMQSSTAWYLRAYCLDREAERTFVLDGMREVCALPRPKAEVSERSDAPVAMDASEATETPAATETPVSTETLETAGSVESSVAPQELEAPSSRHQTIGPIDAKIPARLRVRESALHRIMSFSPKVQGTAGDGWVWVSVKLAYSGAAVRLVQAAPGDLTVVTPSGAREAALNWVEQALAQYDA